MKKIFLLIAGFTFQIEFIKTEWHKSQTQFRSHILNHFKSFVINTNCQTPDITISFIHYTKPKSIIRQIQSTYFIQLYEQKTSHKIQTNYGISLLQFQLIIRNCLEKLLLKHNGLLLHASANYINNKSVVFFGPSGAGKTTISGFLNKEFRSLADDSIILRKIDKSFKIYQTPFQEKVPWVEKNKAEYPLGKICILKQSPQNKLTLINNNGVMFKYLLNQVWFTKAGIKQSVPTILHFLSMFHDFAVLEFKKDGPAIVQFLKKNV